MVKFGRKLEDCKILFGVQPIVGETEEIALMKEKQILELASVEAGLTWISGSFGTDLSGYDFDQPLSEIESDALQSKLYKMPKRIPINEDKDVLQLLSNLCLSR